MYRWPAAVPSMVTMKSVRETNYYSPSSSDRKPISVTGHADIVETQNGEWWMVLLAVRPYVRGHYNLGRETFMVPLYGLKMAGQ